MADNESRSVWTRWADARALRWGVVALLLIAAVIVSSIDGLIEVCEEQLAETGSKEVVDVCRRPSLSDPTVVGFLLLVLVGCLWPDISEISIGVLSLTRKVDEQAERTENVSRDLRLLGLELRQTISQQVSQRIYIGTAAAGLPSEVTSSAVPGAGVSLEELLAPVRQQDAYLRANIPAAWRLLDDYELRPVRVAVVATPVDRDLLEVPALGPHLAPPYLVPGASSQPAVPVATASAGHSSQLRLRQRLLLSEFSTETHYSRTRTRCLWESPQPWARDRMSRSLASAATRPSLVWKSSWFRALRESSWSPPQGMRLHRVPLGPQSSRGSRRSDRSMRPVSEPVSQTTA